jgi:hypothetical protein
MARLSAKQRERYAEAVLAAADGCVVERPGWRESGCGCPVETAVRSMLDPEQFDACVAEYRRVAVPTVAEWKALGLPLHAPRLMPGDRIEADSYDGMIAAGLTIAQRIREGWRP